MSTKKKPTPKTEAQNAEETELAMLRRRNEELNAHIKEQEAHVDGWKQYASDLRSRHEVLLNSLARIATCPSSEIAGVNMRNESVGTMRRVSEMPLRCKEQSLEDRLGLGQQVEFCIKRASANR